MTESMQRVVDKYAPHYDDINILLISGRSKSVQMMDDTLETTNYQDDTKILVRAIKDHRLITSGFTGAGAEDVSDFLDQGRTVISSLPADEHCFFPAYALPEGDLGLCDSSFESVTMQELTQYASEVVQSARETDSRVASVKQSSASAALRKSITISTNSPVLIKEKTIFSAGAYLIASENGEEMDGYDSVSNVMLKALNHRQAGIYAAENACSLLGGKSINTGQYNIIFSAAVMADFMDLILELTDGENVYKGVSMLADKLGKKCASDIFTLTDDPCIIGGRGSQLCDAEGQTCEKLTIFDKGVLKSYLHNSYTAHALGQQNTARAVLGAGGNLGIGSTNILLKQTTDKSIGDVATECLRITEVMGMHTADPVSGDFSVGISGTVLRDGEAVHPFKEAVISGNLADLLMGAVHVFDNSRTFGNITTSDTLFDSMTVSGV